VGINELFDGIAKVVGQFAEKLAEQRLQEKMSRTGRGPKVNAEKTEKGDGKKREIYRNFPKTG